MISRLRKKFIILSAVSLLLLLFVIVVSSSVLTYIELVENADMVLSLIADSSQRQNNTVEFTKPFDDEKKPSGENAPKPSDTDDPPEPLPDASEDGGKPPQMREPAGKSGIFGNKQLSLETMYESRFFTVIVSSDGEITDINTDNIITIDEQDAEEYAALAIGRTSASGFVGTLRYLKQENENDTYVIFLDCGRTVSTYKRSIIINCVISLAGFLVSMIVIVIFSGKIMRPVLESYEKQKQFISVAGHELKTPVTIIDADAEVLSMELEEENEWLSDIRSQTKRMEVLTNDLLNLSRMDENREQFTMIEFPISDVVGETVQSVQTLAHTKDRELHADIAPMLSYTGDEKAIRQITGILLDNAIKYSTSKDIELKMTKKGNNIILTVKNSAEPLRDEQLHQLFDRFYRTEQSRNSEKGGYGLGLSIAKAMVEAHKGKISATAPADGYVQITVTLKCS